MRIDRERQQRARRRKKSDRDLHLTHERKHPALAPVHRQTGINPSLRSAFHQHAACHTGARQFLDGAAGTATGLAEHINRLAIATLLATKVGGIQFIERNQVRAGHMDGGVFAGCADIKQVARLTGGEAAL